MDKCTLAPKCPVKTQDAAVQVSTINVLFFHIYHYKNFYFIKVRVILQVDLSFNVILSESDNQDLVKIIEDRLPHAP